MTKLYEVELNSNGMPNFSTAKEVPQHIKGKWKRTKANSGYNAEWVCSNCGYTVYAEFCNYNYCSSCGSDMRGDEDDQS